MFCPANPCVARPRDGQGPAQPGHQRRVVSTVSHGRQALRAGLMLAMVSGVAAPAAPLEASGAPQAPQALKSAQAPTDLAGQVLRLVNLHRSRQDLPTWEPDTALAAIATAHSQHMAQRQQIGHDGFDARFAQARRRHCVENLAAGFDRAEPLLAAWLASPSHRDNLLATRPRQVGLGQVAGYVTLMACEPAGP